MVDLRFLMSQLDLQYDWRIHRKLTLTPRINYRNQTPWQDADQSSPTYFDKTVQRVRGSLILSYDILTQLHLLTGVDGIVAQYDSYEVLPGLKINGRLTAGENIGDNGGLAVAYEAYKLSLGGKESPVLGGFGGAQRFFHGWAQVWRTLIRDQRLRSQVTR